MASHETTLPQFELAVDATLEAALLVDQTKPKVILIDGPQASGKTALADLIKSKFPATIINTDWSLKAKETYRGDNYDFWWRKNLLYGILNKYLRAQGQNKSSISFNNVYQHGTQEKGSQLIARLELPISPLTIVEGIFAISPETLYLVNQKYSVTNHLIAISGLDDNQLMSNELGRVNHRHQTVKQQAERMQTIALPNWRNRETEVINNAQFLCRVDGPKFVIYTKPTSSTTRESSLSESALIEFFD